MEIICIHQLTQKYKLIKIISYITIIYIIKTFNVILKLKIKHAINIFTFLWAYMTQRIVFFYFTDR